LSPEKPDTSAEINTIKSCKTAGFFTALVQNRPIPDAEMPASCDNLQP